MDDDDDNDVDELVLFNELGGTGQCSSESDIFFMVRRVRIFNIFHKEFYSDIFVIFINYRHRLFNFKCGTDQLWDPSQDTLCIYI